MDGEAEHDASLCSTRLLRRIDEKSDQLRVRLVLGIALRKPLICRNVRLVLAMGYTTCVEVVARDTWMLKVSDEPRKVTGDHRVHPHKSEVVDESLGILR